MRKYLLTMIMCLALAVTSLTGCELLSLLEKSAGPEATIEKLEKALNDMDLDGIIECMEPSFQRQYKMYSGVAGMVAGVMGFDISMDDLLPTALGFAELMGDDLEWPTFTIDVLKVQDIDDDNAAVTVSVGGKKRSGETYAPETEVWNMIKEDDTWYIKVE